MGVWDGLQQMQDTLNSHTLSSHPYMCFSSSVPPLLPNHLPHHPSLLFLKFHDLLLTSLTNDLLFPSLFLLWSTHLSFFLSLCPFFLPLPLSLPLRSSKDSAYEEHHRSGRKKHFHKLPRDWVPLLFNQLVQGRTTAA